MQPSVAQHWSEIYRVFFIKQWSAYSWISAVSTNIRHFLYQTSQEIQFTTNFVVHTSIGKEEDVDFWGLLYLKEKKISVYMKTDIFVRHY